MIYALLTIVLKTIEVTQMQVGDSAKNVNIIVSTVAEAEYVMPYLRDCKNQQKTVNVRLFTRGLEA